MEIVTEHIQAGCVLNLLVAEQVMGLRRCDWHTPGCWIPKEWPERHPHDWQAVPNYSTSIAAAWEVVEHLIGRPGRDGVHIKLVTVDVRSGSYLCEIESYGTVTEMAETAPLAICLAALKAVE